MQTYDFLMLAVLIGATVFGFVKGMAWQVAYVASLVVSYFAAVRFSPHLAPTFGETAPFNRFVAMLVIYMVTSMVIWMIFRGVAGAIDRVKLKEFDRQMGALLGFARGVLWCVAITFFAATLLETYRPAILGSRAGHYIGVLLAKSDAVVPPEVQKVIGPYVDRIEQGLDPNSPGGSGAIGGGALPQTGQGGWPFSGSPSPATDGGSQLGNQPPAGTSATPWPNQQQNSDPNWPQQPTSPTPWPN